jgi:tetratricopeptide (TPR) repeat protein
MTTADELKEQGIRQFQEQDYEEAAETFRAAAAEYEDAGVADMVAEMQVNLGLALHMMGEHESALEQMNMAHQVFVQINDSSRIAQALGNMGRVHARMGNSEQAITNYREAATIFQELDDQDNYGQTILAIADLQLRSGQLMKAAATYEIGLDYVKNPNPRQKLMKGLLSLKNRIVGGGAPRGDDEPDEAAEDVGSDVAGSDEE